MAIRNIYLAPGQIYHIYNRGVDGMSIYRSNSDRLRFVHLTEYYRFTKVPVCYSHYNKMARVTRIELMQELVSKNELHVQILAFCLMPNHFHFLIKQISPQGIFHFMRQVQNGYVKYFNTATKRQGPLFQSAFKAVHIAKDEQLLHVSRYIHINPTTAYLVNRDTLADYPWSSLACYLPERTSHFSFVEMDEILAFFNSKKAYQDFVFDQIEYQRELKNIKHLLIE